MSISDKLHELPPHYRRAWHAFQSEQCRSNPTWVILDHAAEALSRTHGDLSAEVESLAEDLIDVEPMFDQFMEWMKEAEKNKAGA
jgi:hypothetical protein